MRVLKHILIVLFVWFMSTNQAKAQIDTTFWFAAPWVTPSHADNVPIKFHFSTFDNATTITIRQPQGGINKTFTVAANTLYSYDVSNDVNIVECKPADLVLPYGFQITSDFPIVVVYDVITTANNPETYLNQHA